MDTLAAAFHSHAVQQFLAAALALIAFPPIHWVLLAALSMFALLEVAYLLYAAIMHFVRVRATTGLTPAMKCLGYPALAVGLFLDAALNVVIFTIIFWELPPIRTRFWRPARWRPQTGREWVRGMVASVEWLVTTRLSRHKLNADLARAAGDAVSWRGRLAIWICAELLDRFDPSGCHCKVR